MRKRPAAAIKNFNEKLAELKIEHCPGCREEGFHIKLTHEELCTRSSGDIMEPRRWSNENNTNPTYMPQFNVPPCLQYLTDMEEMPIARTKTIMQVRWTKGR
ncbi:hypothetical protein DFH08DRAFT_682815 [Mycena albidolilacea]|uniref:Uncharacterized protein n=1 Tax=Mycena albidolilacea TaxID=1033008 RepID=A0AAD7AMV4_9AGAR|nr:hypothetical protein DFH08DRAFT_682815 [Mycena albidolilacea]